MQKIKVLLSFLGLWLTSYLSVEDQTFLGFGLIFSFGILHGANDLQLINHIEYKKKRSFLKILLGYVVLVLLSALLFLSIPIFTLLLFVVVSAYHFGEQNWQEYLKDYNKTITGLYQFIYGILILVALFYFNAPEVEKIIFKIAAITILEHHFLILLLISLSLYTVISLFIIRQRKDLQKIIVEQTFYIMVLCIIFNVASLFLGFAIYFIFWHSIPSLNDQIKFLYGSYSFANFKRYFKSAFLYWAISLIGVSIFYTISKDMVIFDALFFSFLASITFPHFIIIIFMYKKEEVKV
jgi:Brp/Blh family beta-carotene 15,15'-monooxygenase